MDVSIRKDRELFKYFWITKSKIAEVIEGCINIQRPQVMNSQRLSTEPLLDGSSEAMPLISSFLTMKFKKSSVWLQNHFIYCFNEIIHFWSIFFRHNYEPVNTWTKMFLERCCTIKMKTVFNCDVLAQECCFIVIILYVTLIFLDKFPWKSSQIFYYHWL